MKQLSEDLCLWILLNTANDSTISIKLFLSDYSFQKYEFIAEMFLSEQRAMAKWNMCFALCAMLWPFTLPQYLLESWISSCMPPDRDSLQYVLDIWETRHFQFSRYRLGISLRLFLPHLRGHCFVSPGSLYLQERKRLEKGLSYLGWKGFSLCTSGWPWQEGGCWHLCASSASSALISDRKRK